MMGDIKAIKTSFWINVLFEDVFVIEGFPENSFGIIKRITLRCTRKYVLYFSHKSVDAYYFIYSYPMGTFIINAFSNSC